MNLRFALRTSLVFLTALMAFSYLGASIARSADLVYLRDDEGEKKFKSGHIASITSTLLTIETIQGSLEVPANEITRVVFSSQPPALTSAQTKLLAGDYEAALTLLDKDEIADDKRREVTEEAAFSRAFCEAQIALAGRGDVTEAGRKMNAFVSSASNSHHYYQACEVVGDLLVASGKLQPAQEFYAKLGQAPWPDFKMRSQIAMGRAYLGLGNAVEAEKSFDAVISTGSTGALTENQVLLARIGKARCQVVTGSPDTAMRMVKEILAKTEKSPDIQASGYNTIGAAYRKMNKPKDAILAFLHTHLMYPSVAEADAEAVGNLELLFLQTRNAGHAQEMRKILDINYKNSRWAQLKK